MRANERHETAVEAVEDLDIDPDLLFDVLARPRRRAALACLDERSAPMALTDLASEIIAWEHDVTVTRVPAEAIKEVHVSLYHVDVPKMSDAGLLVYDRDRETVTTTATGEEIASAVPLPTVSSRPSPEPRFDR